MGNTSPQPRTAPLIARAAAREEGRQQGRREVLDRLRAVYLRYLSGESANRTFAEVARWLCARELESILRELAALPAEEAQPHCPRCGRETAIAALCPLCYPPAEEAQHE